MKTTARPKAQSSRRKPAETHLARCVIKSRRRTSNAERPIPLIGPAAVSPIKAALQLRSAIDLYLASLGRAEPDGVSRLVIKADAAIMRVYLDRHADSDQTVSSLRALRDRIDAMIANLEGGLCGRRGPSGTRDCQLYPAEDALARAANDRIHRRHQQAPHRPAQPHHDGPVPRNAGLGPPAGGLSQLPRPLPGRPR